MHLKHYSIEHDDTLNTNDPKQFGSLYHVSLHYGGLLLRVTNSRTGLVHTLDPGVYTLGSLHSGCLLTRATEFASGIVHTLGLHSGVSRLMESTLGGLSHRADDFES